jgi:hypothetical protein
MWHINDFNKWVEDGRPINDKITELSIAKSNIEILGNLENLVNLRELYCVNNQLISLKGIENCIKLEYLNCSGNKLTSLEGIENLINLEYLYCINNCLTTLKGIEKLTILKNIYCDNNFLTSFEEIINLHDLKILSCKTNQLTILVFIENIINFIKHNKKIPNFIIYDLIDFRKYDELDHCINNYDINYYAINYYYYYDEYIELKKIFDILLKCKNQDEIDEYIEKIEEMIKELNGFQKYVLK